MPSTIEQIHREYGRHGLTVLAIDPREARDVLGPWLKSRGVTTTVLLDPTGSVARSYGVTHTPTVFLVDRNGGLVGKSVGVRDWTGDEGRALLRRLLAPLDPRGEAPHGIRR